MDGSLPSERKENKEKTNDFFNPLFYIPKFFKILTKPDQRAQSQLVPMTLLPVQQHYISNRTNRDIILKARQLGLSSGVMAANSHKIFTEHYNKMAIITHSQETSEFLLQTVQRFHRNLPDELRPEVSWLSSERIRFPGLDSLIYIDSAESKSIGFGQTLNIAHLSELSRWPEFKSNDLFAGITQTLSEGAFLTIESTPRGRRGLFYRLYEAAKRGDLDYKTFFYPWWWDIEYKRPIKGNIGYSKEEQLLVDAKKLSPEQIMFRREKIAELGDLFYQEYPENEVDCWLSSDISVFDGMAIRRYLQQVQSGRAEGALAIWKDVIGGEKYVIGVDVAGGHEKGDFSVASVLRTRTNEYVARIRARIAPDLFAQEVLRLGHRYNDAQIGVERTMHGHTVLHILLQANYPNLYYHQDYDSFTQLMSTQVGWITTGKTKPIMVDTMSAAIRSGDIILWSENLLDEASGYIWEGQKAKKSPGAFDDELDAFMIALQLRELMPITETQRYKTVSYAHLSRL